VSLDAGVEFTLFLFKRLVSGSNSKISMTYVLDILPDAGISHVERRIAEERANQPS
jgi:hypothetical protein